MRLDFISENKYKATALLVVLAIVSAGLYLSMQDVSQEEQTPDEDVEPVQNDTQETEDEPENPVNETEQTGEVVEDYNNTKETTQSGTNYSISLQTPPERGESTDIYFTKNGEGVESVPIYLDGEYQRDTQDGLAAGRAFVNVPSADEFEISIEMSGENYTETFETVAE